jgi:hypothetical protein
MGFKFANEAVIKNILPILPGASTVSGFISSSDIGKLVVASSDNAVLAIGTTADFAQGILGIVALVPTATTPASTTPFYYAPIVPGEKLVATYSTSFSTALPATTDLGKYVGFSNTTTVAGAESLSFATVGNVKGSTSGRFFKIAGHDNTRKVLFGTINSSHLAV